MQAHRRLRLRRTSRAGKSRSGRQGLPPPPGAGGPRRSRRPTPVPNREILPALRDTCRRRRRSGRGPGRCRGVGCGARARRPVRAEGRPWRTRHDPVHPAQRSQQDRALRPERARSERSEQHEEERQGDPLGEPVDLEPRRCGAEVPEHPVGDEGDRDGRADDRPEVGAAAILAEPAEDEDRRQAGACGGHCRDLPVGAVLGEGDDRRAAEPDERRCDDAPDLVATARGRGLRLRSGDALLDAHAACIVAWVDSYPGDSFGFCKEWLPRLDPWLWWSPVQRPRAPFRYVSFAGAILCGVVLTATAWAGTTRATQRKAQHVQTYATRGTIPLRTAVFDPFTFVSSDYATAFAMTHARSEER